MHREVKEELLLLPESLNIRRMSVHAQRLDGIHGHELIPLVGFLGIQDRPSGLVQQVLLGSFPEIGLSSLSTLVVHRNQRFSNILRIHHAIRRSGIVLVEDNG